MVEHAAGDVTDVGRAAAGDLRLHALEQADVMLRALLEAVLDVATAGANPSHDVVQQRDILQHQQLGVENLGFGVVQSRRHFVAHLDDVGTGGRDGGIQAAYLGLRILVLEAGHQRHAPEQHVGRPPRHPCGRRDAGEPDLGPVAFGLHARVSSPPQESGGKALCLALP
jgi:hypothetical protein